MPLGGCRTRVQRSPTRDAASDVVAHTSVPCFFFFFFFLRFTPTQLDSRWLSLDSCQFTPNQADSARIGPYRPYRVVLAGDRYGRNMPKKAEICLESGRKIRNSHLRGILMCFLPSSFFVL